MGVGVVHPETNTPYRVKKTGLGKKHTARVEQIAVHRRVRENLAEVSEERMYAFTLPKGVVEATNAAADAFVRLGIRPAQHEFQCTVFEEDARLFRHHILLCAGITKHRSRRMPTVPVTKEINGAT